MWEMNASWCTVQRNRMLDHQEIDLNPILRSLLFPPPKFYEGREASHVFQDLF